jgi:UDP-N-acetylmuramoylalanine--D-glutamate ligase
MDVGAVFRGKKITLLGLGLLGRGLGDAIFFAESGADLIVTDKKSEAELAASVEQLRRFPNITLHLGVEDINDFKGRDLVVKAAGVPQDSPLIAAAKAEGIPVAMSTALFAREAERIGATIAGITGTRGKSTVTHMIFHALQKAGKRAHLGGNIRGISTLALLPEVQAGDIAVLELDSWQLQGFGDMRLSPHIAVFTNLMPDHMNYYAGDMNKYFDDKANIFKYQKPGDSLFVGTDIAERIRATHSSIDPVVPHVPGPWQLRVRGAHNAENAALAALTLTALGLSEEEIREGLESFTAVEGRLQFVREVRGVQLYNDNNATTPEATIAALKSFDDKRVILIAGGSDKHLDLSHLIKEIARSCKSVVLLEGAGTTRLLETGLSAPTYSNIVSALDAAMADASAG